MSKSKEQFNYVGWTFKSFNATEEDYVWYSTKFKDIGNAVSSLRVQIGANPLAFYAFTTEKPKHLNKSLTL